MQTRVRIVNHPTIPNNTLGVIQGGLPKTKNGTVEVTFTVPRRPANTQEIATIYLVEEKAK